MYGKEDNCNDGESDVISIENRNYSLYSNGHGRVQ